MTNSISESELVTELQLLAARLGKTPTPINMHEAGNHHPKRYQEVFGSWDAALEAANLDPESVGAKRIPDRELLGELQRLAAELGSPPTRRDMEERGEWSSKTYQNRFGSWSDALRQAMLDTNDGVSDSDLLREVRRLAEELGHPPTWQDIDERAGYSAATYYRRFGTRLDIADAAELDTSTLSQNTLISTDELAGELRRLADELGRRPSPSDMDREGVYSAATYYRRFGSWSAACEAVGIDCPDRDDCADCAD